MKLALDRQSQSIITKMLTQCYYTNYNTLFEMLWKLYCSENLLSEKTNIYTFGLGWTLKTTHISNEQHTLVWNTLCEQSGWNGVTEVFPPFSKFMIISTLQIFNAK